MDLGDALEWLDNHQNLERMLADQHNSIPDPARMRRLVDVLGDPQNAFPVIHLTGTNGKTSTARALTQLLMAKGLSVGTFTSPHLERINERISANGVPISDEDRAPDLPGSSSSPPPPCAGSPMCPSTWRSSMWASEGAGTPPTWSTGW